MKDKYVALELLKNKAHVSWITYDYISQVTEYSKRQIIRLSKEF